MFISMGAIMSVMLAVVLMVIVLIVERMLKWGVINEE